MDKQEKIVCAAVSLYVIPLENWHAEPFDHVFKVIDYEDYKEENLYRNLEILGEPVFGFFTSKKRFVDAKEAMEIAIEQDQILEINNCFAEFHEAQLSENFRKVNTLLGELQSLKLKHASRELKPGDLY